MVAGRPERIDRVDVMMDSHIHLHEAQKRIEAVVSNDQRAEHWYRKALADLTSLEGVLVSMGNERALDLAHSSIERLEFALNLDVADDKPQVELVEDIGRRWIPEIVRECRKLEGLEVA